MDIVMGKMIKEMIKSVLKQPKAQEYMNNFDIDLKKDLENEIRFSKICDNFLPKMHYCKDYQEYSDKYSGNVFLEKIQIPLLSINSEQDMICE